MRRSRGPEPLIDALVRFMESFYSPRELTDAGIRIAREDTADAEADSLRRVTLAQLMKLPALTERRDEILAAMPGDLAQDVSRNLALSSTAGATAIDAMPALHRKDASGERSEVPQRWATAQTLLDDAATLHAEDRGAGARPEPDVVDRKPDSSSPCQDGGRPGKRQTIRVQAGHRKNPCYPAIGRSAHSRRRSWRC